MKNTHHTYGISWKGLREHRLIFAVAQNKPNKPAPDNPEYKVPRFYERDANSALDKKIQKAIQSFREYEAKVFKALEKNVPKKLQGRLDVIVKNFEESHKGSEKVLMECKDRYDGILTRGEALMRELEKAVSDRNDGKLPPGLEPYDVIMRRSAVHDFVENGSTTGRVTQNDVDRWGRFKGVLQLEHTFTVPAGLNFEFPEGGVFNAVPSERGSDLQERSGHLVQPGAISEACGMQRFFLRADANKNPPKIVVHIPGTDRRYDLIHEVKGLYVHYRLPEEAMIDPGLTLPSDIQEGPDLIIPPPDVPEPLPSGFDPFEVPKELKVGPIQLPPKPNKPAEAPSESSEDKYNRIRENVVEQLQSAQNLLGLGGNHHEASLDGANTALKQLGEEDRTKLLNELQKTEWFDDTRPDQSGANIVWGLHVEDREVRAFSENVPEERRAEEAPREDLSKKALEEFDRDTEILLSNIESRVRMGWNEDVPEMKIALKALQDRFVEHDKLYREHRNALVDRGHALERKFNEIPGLLHHLEFYDATYEFSLKPVTERTPERPTESSEDKYNRIRENVIAQLQSAQSLLGLGGNAHEASLDGANTALKQLSPKDQAKLLDELQATEWFDDTRPDQSGANIVWGLHVEGGEVRAYSEDVPEERRAEKAPLRETREATENTRESMASAFDELIDTLKSGGVESGEMRNWLNQLNELVRKFMGEAAGDPMDLPYEVRRVMNDVIDARGGDCRIDSEDHNTIIVQDESGRPAYTIYYNEALEPGTRYDAFSVEEYTESSAEYERIRGEVYGHVRAAKDQLGVEHEGHLADANAALNGLQEVDRSDLLAELQEEDWFKEKVERGGMNWRLRVNNNEAVEALSEPVSGMVDDSSPSDAPPEAAEAVLTVEDFKKQFDDLFEEMHHKLSTQPDGVDAAKDVVGSKINPLVTRAFHAGLSEAVNDRAAKFPRVELKARDGTKYRFEQEDNLFALKEVDEGLLDKEKELLEEIKKIFRENSPEEAMKKLWDLLKKYFEEQGLLKPAPTLPLPPVGPAEGGAAPPAGPDAQPRFERRETLRPNIDTEKIRQLEEEIKGLEEQLAKKLEEWKKFKQMDPLDFSVAQSKQMERLNHEITNLEQSIDKKKEELRKLREGLTGGELSPEQREKLAKLEEERSRLIEAKKSARTENEKGRYQEQIDLVDAAIARIKGSATGRPTESTFKVDEILFIQTELQKLVKEQLLKKFQDLFKEKGKKVGLELLEMTITLQKEMADIALKFNKDFSDVAKLGPVILGTIIEELRVYVGLTVSIEVGSDKTSIVIKGLTKEQIVAIAKKMGVEIRLEAAPKTIEWPAAETREALANFMKANFGLAVEVEISESGPISFRFKTDGKFTGLGQALLAYLADKAGCVMRVGSDGMVLVEGTVDVLKGLFSEANRTEIVSYLTKGGTELAEWVIGKGIDFIEGIQKENTALFASILSTVWESSELFAKMWGALAGNPERFANIVMVLMKNREAIAKALTTLGRNPELFMKIAKIFVENPQLFVKVLTAVGKNPKALDIILAAAAKTPWLLETILNGMAKKMPEGPGNEWKNLGVNIPV